MDELTLNCWFRSENPEALSQVKISNTARVFDLREAIKNITPPTLFDFDEDVLALFKPKTAISEPYKENLSKFILSEHGELLWPPNKLSKIFPKPPPERDIHVIVDAPLSIVCWIRGADCNDSFRIPIQPGEDIAQLMPRIHALPNLRSILANHQIRLYKISGGDNELRECLNTVGSGGLLHGATLAHDFRDVPVLDPLRVVIAVSAIGGSGPTLVKQQRSGLQEYQDIFLEVENWSGFKESDIRWNWISSTGLKAPDFVTTFERKLERKPRLPLDVRAMQTSGVIPEEHFEPYQTPTAKDPQEEMRYADPLEVAHTTYHIAPYNWRLSWRSKDLFHSRNLDKHIMASIFFDPLYVQDKRDTVLRGEPWPFKVVVKRDDKNGTELRQYQCRSDFLIINSDLPRLLVGSVNSTYWTEFPKDLRRMLATGAFVVRFANNFVSTFSQEKNFVLCAFFVFPGGTAFRYTLFQIPNNKHDWVYYREKRFELYDPLGRVELARHLYNLRAELDQSQDQAALDAVRKFRDAVRDGRLKSMYTEPETGHTESTESDDDDSADGGDENADTVQLRAHGYEVEPKVFVDDSGGTWEPIYKTPDHILTVYRPTNRNKVFIAKKFREDSNELEFLKLLDSIPLKSDHVIALIDSFDGWAILPKMTTLDGYLGLRSDVFGSKVSQVCLGLIKGLMYLHMLHIAHRDVKPDNLVVDKATFTLRIIDFDVATRVRDADQEVDGRCGTKGWMAPEVAKKLRHSPIKADRWSCGRVLLFLLDTFGKKEVSLRAFAKDLVAHDPKQRPSLLEWGRYLAPPFSDSGNRGNAEAGKTSQRRRDRAEGDGEITKPPTKKQRPDSG